MTKFLYRPILTKLEERKKKVEEGLLYTEKAKRETEEINKRRQEIINRAKEEARGIIEEGKKSGKNLEKEIIESAHQEAAQILEKGKGELELMRSQMERQLKIQTVGIARSMVKKLLEDVLTLSDHRTIIDKKIEEISKLPK